MARLVVGLLALCSLSACPAAPEEAAPLVPTAWHYEDPAAGAPPRLSVTEVEDELANVVAFLGDTDPLLIFEAIQVGFQRFRPECPQIDSHNNQQYVQGDCVTDDGTGFFGYALTVRIQGMVSLNGEPAEHHRDFSWTTGNLAIEAPDGYTLDLLGDCEYHDYDTVEGYPAFGLYLWGDFKLDDGETTNWLSHQYGVHLYLDSVDYPEGRRVAWSGGASRLGGKIDAFSLDGFEIAEDGACAGVEPTGTVWLWDTDLNWYEVAFDDTCDGCADVRVDGASIGSACADWSPLLTWEDRPWSP